MPSLKFLSFKYGWIGDKEGFGRILLAASGLEMLNIDHVTYNGQDVELLSDVLPTLPSLKALSLSFVLFLHKPMNSYQEACKLAQEQQTKPPNRQTFARQKVIRAIGQCSRLEFLSLSGMSMFIGDDTVKDLCDAVTSLRNFRHLRLSGGNRLTALGLSQLSELKSVFLET
ncbi:hypothetical protein CAPTEDRAFT_210602 [Capitella teleta]|uniref:Uncharacterized protein n=1 Tax=Capitella teleta TaxID=283909 RepID=R7U1L2_CAPTE|nr:hypothetical protein CAPTEDRAFT_210602 [Capitella teleta]|eukprot:ELT99757.1 hypothetical protein CAPTEDRAFT_210602 [Capitella teleta]